MKLDRFPRMNGDEDAPRVECERINPDYFTYIKLQRAMKELRHRYGIAGIDDAAFQNAWNASEEIKNRYGGMPPSWDEEVPA